MKSFRVWLMIALALGAQLFVADQALARSEEATIGAAHEVLQQFLNLSLKEIPASLLSDAYGVAIVPGVIKVGFVVGGQYGNGVIAIRQPDGSWRGPMFLTLTGGSVGWQVGAQATDFVLVFKSQKSVEGLQRGKFTLGADAAVAAGPLGRRAGAATDTELKAEIYTYSRARGLFAGVSLEGSALQIDDAANTAYFGTVGSAAAKPPESAIKLVETIARMCANPGQFAAGSQTAPVGTTAPGPLRPTGGASALQGDVVAALMKLNSLLDDNWRNFLAAPAEVYAKGRPPAPEQVAATLRRFDEVAANPQYRNLAQRTEFQTAHRLMKAYYEALTAGSSPRLSLPPPPVVTGNR